MLTMNRSTVPTRLWGNQIVLDRRKQIPEIEHGGLAELVQQPIEPALSSRSW